MPVRPATGDDAEAIAQVHVASWRSAYRRILAPEFLAGLSVEQRQARWSDAIANDLPHVLVADADGQVVGFSAFGPCRDADAGALAFEIWALYLAPSHWDRGLGRELWLASREALLQRGAQRVSLWVIANNARATRFYTLAGFAPQPESLKAFELGGMQLEEVRFWQSLPVRDARA
jgi:ribosomal protein S18 acetylase RimI-like enzyme